MMQSLLINWNNAWPYDYIWRQKYNVPFNSSQHREMTPLDARMDILESLLINKEIKDAENKKKSREKYLEDKQWWRPDHERLPADVIKSQEDELFDNFDVFDT